MSRAWWARRWPILGGGVLARLPGILGCTHLNDALRALTEVPVLAAALT